MVQSTEIDFSAADTEDKRRDNLLGLTGDGAVKRIFYHEEASVDIGSLADAAGATQSISVTGVELGDIVLGASFGVDVADMTVTAYVQSDGTVEVRVQNESGTTVDLSSTTVRLLIADVT